MRGKRLRAVQTSRGQSSLYRVSRGGWLSERELPEYLHLQNKSYASTAARVSPAYVPELSISSDVGQEAAQGRLKKESHVGLGKLSARFPCQAFCTLT